MTTTPIDPTKIRPGDKVTFHETEVVGTGTNFVRVRFSGIRDYDIDLRDIATHTPKQREFKRGDLVTWGMGATNWVFELARGSWACVVHDDNGIKLVQITELRHTDEGADR